MQVQKVYHKCGYPILLVKKPVGSVVETLFVDGNHPFVEKKDGYKSPNVVRQCPECTGFLKMEKLLSTKPQIVEEKAPTGYMPARI